MEMRKRRQEKGTRKEKREAPSSSQIWAKFNLMRFEKYLLGLLERNFLSFLLTPSIPQ
jgi:hypothetical protein